MRRPAGVFASWIALLAVVMAALAPAVSRALSAGAAGWWAEVCSAAANGERQPAAPDGHVFDHCPYCALQAGAVAPPPATAGTATPPSLAFERPLVSQSPVRVESAWRGAPPRGPPLFS